MAIDITSMSYFLIDLNQTSKQPVYRGNGEVIEFIGGIEGLDFCQEGFYSAST